MTDFISAKAACESDRFERILEDLSLGLDWLPDHACAYEPIFRVARDKDDVFFAIGMLVRRGAELDEVWPLLVKTVRERIEARHDREHLDGCILETAEDLEELGIYEPIVEDVRRALPRRATVSAEEALSLVIAELKSF